MAISESIKRDVHVADINVPTGMAGGAPDVDGASECIRHAEGVVDVLLELSFHNKDGSINGSIRRVWPRC